MQGTITAQEIKDIRTGYGLSQKSFATLLGIGVASIVRYEQGATPTKANANLIRAARNPEFMLECLEIDGASIPSSQRAHAEQVVYDYISLDPEEDARMHEGLDAAGLEPTRSMDEVYHYTLQQEILNEQAANLIGELITAKRSPKYSTEDKYVFTSLLGQLAEIKPTIISVGNLDDGKIGEIRGFINCAETIYSKYRMEAEDV